MNRPWKIWLGFAICFGVLVLVIAWVSVTALESDRARQRAEAEANIEEKVRLALWRMDAMLAPIIAQESARPSSEYASVSGKGVQSIASPLSTLPSSNILLHFEVDRQWQLSSPQVQAGSSQAAVQPLQMPPQQVEVASARLKALETILKAPSGSDLSPKDYKHHAYANGKQLFDATAVSTTNVETTAAKSKQVLSKAPQQQAAQSEQMARNDLELGVAGAIIAKRG
jgi:hypothetical protein